MIPRLLHHVWVGDPMPDHLAAYVQGWGALHPGWEQKVWTEADLTDLVNRRLFDEAHIHAPGSEGQFRADVARYEILYRYGGVYVDCDFEARRPLDDLLAGVSCFAAWETDGVWVNNAIMGAVAGHPFVAQLVEGLPLNVGRTAGKRPNVMTGPQYLTRVYRRQPKGAVTVFGSSMFYPYRWDELERGDEEFPDAWAVHHWDNRRKRDGVPV